MPPRNEPRERRRAYSRRRAAFDALAALNVLGVAVAEVSAFPGAGLGFKIYSVLVLALFVTVWLVLRRQEYPLWTLLVLQMVLLGHLAGRFVVLDGVPLYRTAVLGMPMDKVIHAFNSLAGAAFVTVLFRKLGLALRGWEGFIVVMVVAGCGALVEIVEYGGFLLLPTTHIGDYANNTQDLVANLIGAIAGWLAMRFALARSSSARQDDSPTS